MIMIIISVEGYWGVYKHKVLVPSMRASPRSKGEDSSWTWWSKIGPKEPVQIGFIDPILLSQAARAPEKRSYNDINDWWRGDGICSNRSLCWKWNWRWMFFSCIGVSIRLNVKLNIKWYWNLVTKMAFKVCHTWTLIITLISSEVGGLAAFQRRKRTTPVTSRKHEEAKSTQ